MDFQGRRRFGSWRALDVYSLPSWQERNDTFVDAEARCARATFRYA